MLIKLNYPYPARTNLWEFENSKLTTETLPPVKTPKFLGALKSLLHKRKVHTSAFGKKNIISWTISLLCSKCSRKICNYHFWNGTQ